VAYTADAAGPAASPGLSALVPAGATTVGASSPERRGRQRRRSIGGSPMGTGGGSAAGATVAGVDRASRKSGSLRRAEVVALRVQQAEAQREEKATAPDSGSGKDDSKKGGRGHGRAPAKRDKDGHRLRKVANAGRKRR